ncbi:YitT family protein [Palleronia sp. KMU-117]|uniref:YitT family protein n=1 Tax=Palleronia sp. KMU-117 TaxID=3434108 RepID=UPI003D764F3E
MSDPSATSATNEPHTRIEHSLTEDAMAFVVGTALCALGLLFLTHAGLITGQTAGLGVLLSYVTGWSFGAVFFVVNLPFYILAWRRMGPRFTVKSFIAVALVSGMSEVLPELLVIERLDPPLAAFLAGAVTGLGLIVIFRHGASLGGVGVLALYLQDRIGLQAGWTQLAFDACLFAAALAVLDPGLVLWSLMGAVVANTIIAVNHRKDRYIGR